MRHGESMRLVEPMRRAAPMHRTEQAHGAEPMPYAEPMQPSRRACLALASAPLLAAANELAYAATTATSTSTGTDIARRAWPPGRATPPLELPAWEGTRFRLADARGDVVVLNFWASWCEPCRTELPSLELLAQRHERDKLQVLAVNFRETDGAIRRFLEAAPTTLSILRDADGAAAKAYQVRIFPTTVVIGRSGRAAFTVTGEVDWTGAAARQWITSVL